MNYIKKIISLITLIGLSLFQTNLSAKEQVKVGLLGGISGPIAAMAPAMINAAQLAIDQVNAQGGLFPNGAKLIAVIGDSGCNPQNATDAATKLVNISNVSGVIGPYCSGATIAAANSVTIPAHVVMISPSATAPTITSLDDSDLVFRTVSSDAYQGQVLARTILAKGISSVAITYLNNDYGKGLANAFKKEYEKNNGKVVAFSAHSGKKASYRSELASLASKGADTLVIFDYGDGSGLTILRQAIENNFFSRFIGGDGMKSVALINGIGASNLKNFYASSPVGLDVPSLYAFQIAYENEGGNKDSIFIANSYDAAFVLALAIEKAGSGNRAKIANSIRSVASAPGTKIYAGQWKKAKKILASGKEINYVGASGDLEFDSNGDVPGHYNLFKVGLNGFEVDVKNMK